MARGLFLFLLIAPSIAACHSLVDLEVRYEECIEPRIPYVDQFEGDDESLRDRCWRTENVTDAGLAPERRVVVGENDLIIGYSNSEAATVPWDEDPPMLNRRVEGDFVLATKVEVTSGSQANFCGLEEGDGAGILVRAGDREDGARGHRASFLVKPYFENPETVAEDCLDNAPNPPSAIAEAQSTINLRATDVRGIGLDGEADIAVCRIRGSLLFFYRDPIDPEADWQPEDWKILANRSDDIGEGPVDVGLTTTLDDHPYDLHVQGHFNWVALLRNERLDDCMGPLEAFPQPLED
jgi:hypothetical protein